MPKSLRKRFMALDQFATPINLTIDGKQGHETCIGACFALSLQIFVLIYGFFVLGNELSRPFTYSRQETTAKNWGDRVYFNESNFIPLIENSEGTLRFEGSVGSDDLEF